MDAITAADLARIEALVERVGWSRARPLLCAVASIDRRDRVRFLSHRDAATLKVALAVLAGEGPQAVV